MSSWRRRVLLVALAMALQSHAGATGRYTELRYVLERSWTGKTPELAIRPDGTVTIAGSSVAGRRLDAATRRDIARRVAAVDWAHLKPHYDADCDDCDTSDVRIAVDGRPFEVTVYGAGAAGEPPALVALLRSIERVRKSVGATPPIDRNRAKAQPAGAAR